MASVTVPTINNHEANRMYTSADPCVISESDLSTLLQQRNWAFSQLFIANSQIEIYKSSIREHISNSSNPQIQQSLNNIQNEITEDPLLTLNSTVPVQCSNEPNIMIREISTEDPEIENIPEISINLYYKVCIYLFF
jgi:hypothetical protein